MNYWIKKKNKNKKQEWGESFALLNLWNFCTFIAYLKNSSTKS